MSQGPHSGETWTQYDEQATECKTRLSNVYLKHLETSLQNSLEKQGTTGI